MRARSGVDAAPAQNRLVQTCVGLQDCEGGDSAVVSQVMGSEVKDFEAQASILDWHGVGSAIGEMLLSGLALALGFFATWCGGAVRRCGGLCC